MAKVYEFSITPTEKTYRVGYIGDAPPDMSLFLDRVLTGQLGISAESIPAILSESAHHSEIAFKELLIRLADRLDIIDTVYLKVFVTDDDHPTAYGFRTEAPTDLYKLINPYTGTMQDFAVRVATLIVSMLYSAAHECYWYLGNKL